MLPLNRHIIPSIIIHDENFKTFDLSGFVQQVRIQKTLNQPVHSMSVVLNPSRNGNVSDNISHDNILNYLKQKIKIQSVITVKMDNKSTKHSFVGFVDHRFEKVTSLNSSTQRTLVLQCSLLLPKLLIKDNIINAPVLATNPVIKEQLKDRVQFFNWMRGLDPETSESPFAGKPEDAVKWILDNAIATNTNLGNDINPKTFFDPKKKDYQGNSLLKFQFLDNELLFSPNLSRYSGSIYNYILNCIDQSFYEVFFDSTTGEDGLGYNEMIIRPKPFTYKNYVSPIPNLQIGNWTMFEDLNFDSPIIINKNGRFSEDLGINDYELKNVFSLNFLNAIVGSATTYLGKFGLQFPVVNLDSIKKYGLRELTATSTMINMVGLINGYNDKIKTDAPETTDKLTSKDESGLLQYLLEKREKIVEWYSFPFFESGQISLPYDENITIGKKLYYEDKEYDLIEDGKVYTGVYYYINTVEEAYNYGDTPTSNISVIRGAPDQYVSNYLTLNRPKFISIDKYESNAETVSYINRSDYDKVTAIIKDVMEVVLA